MATFLLLSSSSLLLLLLLLLSSIVFSSYALTDAEALLKFKSSLSNNAALANWANNVPPCEENKANWAGVLCDKGVVWGLQLENMGLSGTIDVNTLSSLSNLRTLSLMGNDFNGPLPDLKKLVALKSIFLSKNRFSGDIPADGFTGMIWLKKLHLSQNQFTGPIPSSLAALPKLLELRLDGNQFSGRIPEFKQTGLETLDLSNNQLEGPIPTSLSKMDANVFSGNQEVCGPPLKPCDPSKVTLTPPNPNDNIPDSNSNPNPEPQIATLGSSKKPSSTFIIILALVGVFLLLAVLAAVLMMSRRDRQPPLSVEAPPSNLGTKSGIKEAEDNASSASVHSRSGGKRVEGPKLSFLTDERGTFDLTDLLRASAEVLGSGCFGSSYKAALPSGMAMVVKRYKRMNNVGKEEFQEHMRRIGRLRHTNLLPVIAYYYRKEEKLIVSDYVRNGSLAIHLHGHQSLGKPALDWEKRLKIVKGVARGLTYLYKELPSLIAPHGHLKSSNILINESYEPLISDFGLIPVINQESAQELMVAYKSPEYIQNGRITKKTDVWGLGILILEIITGKFPANFLPKGKGNEEDLATWVRTVVDGEEMSVEELIDKDMGESRTSNGEEIVKLLKIGLSCCEVDVEKRLELKEAVERIEELKDDDNNNNNNHDDEDFYSSVASEADKRSSRGLSDDFVFN